MGGSSPSPLSYTSPLFLCTLGLRRHVYKKRPTRASVPDAERGGGGGHHHLPPLPFVRQMQGRECIR